AEEQLGEDRHSVGGCEQDQQLQDQDFVHGAPARSFWTFTGSSLVTAPLGLWREKARCNRI
ncbi:MAG TPA: hypothetical protein VFQ31_05705, partial [Methyloceanibacter sp.]|nr:hypothetical protein [Methyloceanibacter sp.]